MEPVLELTDVTKRFKGFTLDRVSFTLPAGCIMGFIGENGAGKSTTIKLVLGLLHKDAGSVRLFGREDYLTDKRAFEEIGVVLDETGLHDSLTPRDVNAVLSRIYGAWNPDRFFSLCAKLGVPEKKRIKELSGGTKRKLSIAAALAHDPKLLLLDEATSGLDPVVRDELLDLFLEFIQDETHSILLSSHILSDLEKACDYIAFLHQGKLVFAQRKDLLLETYAVFKGGEAELSKIDPARVRGVRRNQFGVEALAERAALPRGTVMDNATIEDIMLFYARGQQQ